MNFKNAKVITDETVKQAIKMTRERDCQYQRDEDYAYQTNDDCACDAYND